MHDTAFDHHSAEFALDPYATLAQYSGCPMIHTDAHGGFHVALTYAEVTAAAQDDVTFRSGCPGISIPEQGTPSIPIETDPPDTQRYRRILQTEMAPGKVRDLEPMVRRRITEMLDEVIERGSCDMVTEFAVPLPARTMMDWIGFDETRWPEFVGWVHTVIHEGADPERHAYGAGNVLGAIAQGVAQRRADGPRRDLLSVLVSSDLTDQEIYNYCFTLVVAGLDTTSAGLANSMVIMDRHPELRSRLIEDPSLMDTAVEEFLRYDSPVMQMARTVATGTVLGGERLAAGDKVMLMWAAANRDPVEFTDPDVVVLDRHPNRHLAFGVGLHRCMGSNVARMIMRIGLAEVLRRMPDYRIVDRENIPRFADAAFVNAPISMPVEFTPGRRELPV